MDNKASFNEYFASIFFVNRSASSRAFSSSANNLLVLRMKEQSQQKKKHISTLESTYILKNFYFLKATYWNCSPVTPFFEPEI